MTAFSRPRRRLAAILCSLSALLLTGTAAQAATPPGPHHPATASGVEYVALGDSYSSGLGAGAYDPASDECMRSSHAYPARWAAAHAVTSFRFTACSGATTGDVIGSQLGPLTNRTDLVSITAGGNDAGFGDVMTTCVTSPEKTCLAKVAGARSFVTSTLPGRLDTLYRTIRDRAPGARVVVLGYPRLYHLNGRCVVGLSERARTAIDEAEETLNRLMAERAAGHGFRFGDVNATFAGHEICSSAPWIHSVTLPPQESYHPTDNGHRYGYLPVFTAQAAEAGRASTRPVSR
ncbi:SGNH/GDSL hydrolase family protein [Streptomyces sp. NPDC049577]|uniref:SGNH/GDSL hydrolase family protein n=1 Tax=Streptomyces sp. NPDC049577 TaxID=3155153 RepID=UPI003437C420